MPSLRPGLLVALSGFLAILLLDAAGQGRPTHFIAELLCVAMAFACYLLMHGILQRAEEHPLYRFYGGGLGVVGATLALHILFSPDFGITPGASLSLAAATKWWSHLLLVCILALGPWLLQRRMSFQVGKRLLLVLGAMPLALIAFATSLPQLQSSVVVGPQSLLAANLLLVLGLAVAAGVNLRFRAVMPPVTLGHIWLALLFSLVAVVLPLLWLPGNLEYFFQLIALYYLYQVLLGQVAGKKGGLFAHELERSSADLEQRNAHLETAFAHQRQELKHSQSVLRSLLDSLPDMIFVFDRDMRCIEVMGRQFPSEANLQGKRVQEFLPAPLAAQATAAATQALAQGEMAVFEFENELSGQRRSREARVVPLDGGTLHLVRDITDRKQLETELQASKAHLEGILQVLPDLIMLIDENGRFTDIRGNINFMLHPSEQVLGRHYQEILPPAIADSLAQAIEQVGKQPQPVMREVEMPHQGKVAIFERRLCKMPNGGVLILNRDITQEKAQQKALAQSESKLATIMSMMPDLVVVLDDQGYYRDFLGNLDLLLEPPETKLNRHYSEFLPPDLALEYETNVQTSRLTGQTVLSEFKLPLHKGLIDAESRVKAGNAGLVLLLLRDITERKEAERALVQNQARLASIVGMLPDFLVVVDDQGYYRNLLGNSSLQTVEEVGKHVREVLPEMVADQYEAHLAEVRAQGAMVMREGKMPIHGVMKDVEVRLQVGDAGFVLLLIRDITERKQAESALAQSQKRLASVLRMMPDLLIVLDGQGYYRDFLGNTDLQTMEQVDKHYREVLPAPIADQYEAHLEEARITGNTVRNEFSLSVKGEMRQIEARVQTGEEGWVLVLLRDITERKQAESALADSQRRLQGILQMIPDMIFVLDDQGVYKSVLGNQEYLVLPLDSLIGKTAPEVLPPALARQVMDNIHAVLTTGHPVEFEYALPLGEQRSWFEGRMVKLEENLTMSLIRNITTRKQAERSIIEAKNAAERANLAKSNFLATMNHELRTPMNGVLGMAQLLAESPLNELQREFVDTILTSGEALVALLTDIMDLTRIETNRIQFKPAETNLGQVLDMVVRLFRGSANAKGLDLSVKLDRTVQPWVLADATLLKQVLSNLVANAIKFSEQGGILVSATLVPSLVEDQRVRFLVKDTGIGMSPDQQPHIFSAFYQVDDSSTRMQGGSGLGLTIVAALVRAMGGEIRVESTLGVGSSFWFDLDLPFSQRAWETVQPPLPEPAQQPGMMVKRPHILIVEDDPNNRLVAQHFMHRANLSYDCAVNGKAALEAALEHDYDLVLMDCRMPIMDGFEATRQLRKMERFAQVPIVALTAKTSEEDRKKCLEAGMNDFISKPVRFEVLRETLAKFLGKGLFQP